MHARCFLAASAACFSMAWATALAQTEPPLAVEVPVGQTLNEDEMADYLNAQQQIKQGVTLTRTVNGQVVETKKETIIYSDGDPIRSTEAAQSALERLKADFDNQSLTRKEAYDEANLDFVIADQDRNGAMTADEFVHLVDSWRKSDATPPAAGEMSRERFVEYLEQSDPVAAGAESAAQARLKFELMAGAPLALDRKAYIGKVLADFDVLDADRDGLLTGVELLNFRAANRGEELRS